MTDKEHVVFWRHLDIPNDPVFWGMVRDFNNINPDLHVEMVEVPWSREHDMLVEAAESGNPPDCSDVPEYWLGEFGPRTCSSLWIPLSQTGRRPRTLSTDTGKRWAARQTRHTLLWGAGEALISCITEPTSSIPWD